MPRKRRPASANGPRPEAQGKQPHGVQKPARSVRRSTGLGDIRQQVHADVVNSVPTPVLPSPSTTSHPSGKVLPPAASCEEELNHTKVPSGSPVSRAALKRKRTADDHPSATQVDGGLARNKSPQKASPDCVAKSAQTTPVPPTDEASTPTEYWVETGKWPERLFQAEINMSQPLVRKRSATTLSSYARGVKQGENPPAYTPEYEKRILVPAGIIMDQQFGDAAIGAEDKELCSTYLQAQYEPPANSLFTDDLFMKFINSIRSENEPRVVRDISLYITPSAEHLWLRGDSKAEHFKETIDAEWTQCVPIVAPRPRPDFSVGFSSSAFSPQELKKLENYRTYLNPTEFSLDLYFPFLTCELKCGVNGLNFADRQNIRNASTAVNAILQLYRGGDESPTAPGFVSRAEQLHRKIVAFTISHNHSEVRIYAHYPLVGKFQTTFYQHLIRAFNIVDLDGKERWTAYNFVRNLYDVFAPLHLKRIRDAIALLPEEKPPSSAVASSAEAESGTSGSQAIVNAAVRDEDGFVRPAVPPPQKKQQTMDTELAALREELKFQREETGRQREENELQREENKRQRGEVRLQREETMVLQAQLLELGRKLTDNANRQ